MFFVTSIPTVSSQVGMPRKPCRSAGSGLRLAFAVRFLVFANVEVQLQVLGSDGLGCGSRPACRGGGPFLAVGNRVRFAGPRPPPPPKTMAFRALGPLFPPLLALIFGWFKLCRRILGNRLLRWFLRWWTTHRPLAFSALSRLRTRTLRFPAPSASPSPPPPPLLGLLAGRRTGRRGQPWAARSDRTAPPAKLGGALAAVSAGGSTR